MPVLLHTMLRTKNLEKSIEFYGLLGMRELRRKDVPDGKFTLVYLGYGGNEKGEAELELTYNWGEDSGYDLGTGFGHLAVGVPDVKAAAEKVRAGGGKVVREPGPLKFSPTVIAFVEDPDGYKVELIEQG